MQVDYIPIKDIIVNQEWNCRSRFFAPSLTSLADSLNQHGQLMPVLIAEGRLIAGFRRVAAAQLAGWTRVFAIISHLDMFTARRVNIVENIERRELSLWEEALALQTLYSTEDSIPLMAKELNKPLKWVSRRWKLLSMEEEIQKACDAGRLTEGDLQRLIEASSKNRMTLLRHLLSEVAAAKAATKRADHVLQDAMVELLKTEYRGHALDALSFAMRLIDFETLLKRLDL